MEESIFEKIINNKLSSFKVYEDQHFIAILDIYPKQKGHTLLIPKIKSENIMKDSDFVQENILKLGVKIANLLKEKLNASGIRMVLNNGKSAGQVIFHTHLHLIPYYDRDELATNDEKVLREILN